MGGSDQWGNITTGTELIRRKSGGEAFAFTCPLLIKSDGGKFGKTEQGNVWLDPNKTSPYQFYQFWLNASDADAEKWVRIFTFLDKTEIDELVAQHNQNPSLRILQKALAKAVTVFVHGEEEYKKIASASKLLFETDPLNFVRSSDVNTIENSGIPIVTTGSAFPVDIITFLNESGSFSSKSEIRRLIQGGGISINNEKINDPNKIIDENDFINQQYILVQKGKKTIYLIRKDM